MRPVGVLALQGDFEAHCVALERAGSRALAVRWPSQLAQVGGLILPGGESTTMITLMRETGFVKPLVRYAREGGAIYGTCAGAILLASRVTNPSQLCLGLIDIDVERNAYGRQRESFETTRDAVVAQTLAGGEAGPMELIFIRAPRIRRVGPGVEVLITHADEPVLVRQGAILAGTFHPELSRDSRVHAYFAEMCRPAPVAA